MDPIMTEVAVAVAGKLTETLTAGAKAALGNLVQLVKKRFAGDDAAQHALTEAEKAPDDADRVTALANQLERLAAEDPKFAEQLRGLWSQTSVHLHAETGGVVNEVSGSVSGHVVQARDIQGGVSFGPGR
jgi:hypothetical protein